VNRKIIIKETVDESKSLINKTTYTIPPAIKNSKKLV